ncbi:hypothetical protein NPIL_580341 [Nephila pilipes]|uniref:Uncharacterized protein n=1 Tax=Nephila pilipes TaxID=299642 RepID=A0A8X6U474_NEPPI|nr:hypothetical protein NPIL_580341 [Nephila pilipes]
MILHRPHTLLAAHPVVKLNKMHSRRLSSSDMASSYESEGTVSKNSLLIISRARIPLELLSRSLVTSHQCPPMLANYHEKQYSSSLSHG